jgi:hypothetical protein
MKLVVRFIINTMIFVLLKFCSAQDTLSASTSKRYSEHLSLLGPFKEGQILEQWELSESNVFLFYRSILED